MKTVLFVLLAMLAIKTAGVTTAVGQSACSNAYGDCLGKCVARPSKGLQDSCMEACQTQNNACFSQTLGVPAGQNSVTVRDEGKGNDAQASDEERPAANKPARTAKPAMKPAERRTQ